MGKSVVQIISEHRGGFIARGLDDQLEQLVERIQETGKKGALTITLQLSPHGKGNRELHARITYSAKTPPPPDHDDESIWFGVRGQLQREDPDQRELFGPKGLDAERADGRSPAEQPASTRTG